MSKRIQIVIALMSFVCFSVAADACPVDMVDIAHSGFGAKSTMNIWGGGHGGTNVYAGVYMVNKTGGQGLGNIWNNGDLAVVCIDLPQQASSASHSYEVISPAQGPNTDSPFAAMGSEKADYLAELWGRFFRPRWTMGNHTESHKNHAEAFAAALWEIVYEDLPTAANPWDVTIDGSEGQAGFRAENLDSQLANCWLGQLDGTGPKAELAVFSNSDHQDFLVQVPEPATLALLGLGSLLFSVGKKRKA